MDQMSGLRLFLSVLAIFLLPGWAAISVFGFWRRWATLQRWCLAIGISIAFLPILFYWARLIPGLRIGPNKLLAIFLACGLVITWQLRRDWKEQFAFDKLEWIAIGVIAATLFTRLWILQDRPYPAWSDSLHHTLLTKLTAESGRLPMSMEPYAPTPLDMYHLGLYAITGSVQQLAGVGAHTALLWTAQILNGLCGVGIYLLLDQMSGRLGAIVGSIVVGLISFQPAWYVNWGRFTQVASLSIMLIAFTITWVSIQKFAKEWQESKHRMLWQLLLAAALNAGVFLLHFRAAAFYSPLVLALVIYLMIQGSRHGELKKVVVATLLIVLVALIMILVVMVPAFRAFSRSVEPAYDLSPAEYQEAANAYFQTKFSAVFEIGLRRPLLVVTIICSIIVIALGNRIGILMAVWIGAITLIGNAYQLGIPVLAFTNLGAGLMMLYIPSGVLVGASVNDVLKRIEPTNRRIHVEAGVLVAFTLLGMIGGIDRMSEKEDFRYFLTDADVEAMAWIRENTSPDALFGINTVMWLPQNPHGRDGGYWIPYFTGLQTTAGNMHVGLGPAEYNTRIVNLSQAVVQFQAHPEDTSRLCDLGVDYFYAGSIAHLYDAGLEASELNMITGLQTMYFKDGVGIYGLCP